MAEKPDSVGIYTIDSEIGRGGMGVVYQGRDTRLDRMVAIKALPESFASDADRLARFEREARTLASLNHPNVAAIYGVEEEGANRFLILEHVDGSSLNDRLAQDPLPIDEALLIAGGIAAGVEAAHEAGVIHRDLKPANVKITPEGVVKVLDFGLAKESQKQGDESGSSLLATQTTPAGGSITTPGLVMGTPAYMSPEQARGKVLDKRTDIWSFGCILFECLGGKQPFAGETVTDSLAAILEREPNWASLSERTPPEIKGLIRHCLEKDPRRRLRDIGDARVILEDAVQRRAWSTTAIAAASGQIARRSRFSTLGWISGVIAAAAIGAAGVALWGKGQASSESVKRLHVQMVSDSTLVTTQGSAIAISPDGSTLAIVAEVDDGRMLLVRRMDQLVPTPLSGTEGAIDPFFSPDGRWIGFFTGSALKKVSTSGGAPLKLADTALARGGSWGDDDMIYYTAGLTTGISRISSSGGTPELLTEPGERERSHRWPHALPGARHVLFMSQEVSGTYDDATIEVVDTHSKERTALHHGGMYPKFARSGHLLYLREGTLFAVAMNPRTLEIRDQPAPVIEGVRSLGTGNGNGGAQLALSHDGTLIYKPGLADQGGYPAVWVDRDGGVTELISTDGIYAFPRLSPDGSKLAMAIVQSAQTDVWIYDLMRGTLSRLTFSETGTAPIWTPSGDYITYVDASEGGRDIYMTRADGVGSPTQITASGFDKHPTSWSPDGRTLAYHQDSRETSWDTWTVRIDENRQPEGDPLALIQGGFIEVWPEISPSGRWIAYESDESGRREVYVRPFQEDGGRWQVSTGGGGHPRWRDDGSEMYFLDGTTVYSVSIDVEAQSFVAGVPQMLFEGSSFINLAPPPSYDAASDGSRFVMFPQDDDLGDVDRSGATVIFNWFEELDRLTRPSR